MSRYKIEKLIVKINNESNFINLAAEKKKLIDALNHAASLAPGNEDFAELTYGLLVKFDEYLHTNQKVVDVDDLVRLELIIHEIQNYAEDCKKFSQNDIVLLNILKAAGIGLANALLALVAYPLLALLTVVLLIPLVFIGSLQDFMLISGLITSIILDTLSEVMKESAGFSKDDSTWDQLVHGHGSVTVSANNIVKYSTNFFRKLDPIDDEQITESIEDKGYQPIPI
ncbi:MAG: hypothetical protein H0U73_08705 [Tatlockia sp.]|nr:hypothetical protein [Tatlockia sp.]